MATSNPDPVPDQKSDQNPKLDTNSMEKQSPPAPESLVRHPQRPPKFLQQPQQYQRQMGPPVYPPGMYPPGLMPGQPPVQGGPGIFQQQYEEPPPVQYQSSPGYAPTVNHQSVFLQPSTGYLGVSPGAPQQQQQQFAQYQAGSQCQYQDGYLTDLPYSGPPMSQGGPPGAPQQPHQQFPQFDGVPQCQYQDQSGPLGVLQQYYLPHQQDNAVKESSMEPVSQGSYQGPPPTEQQGAPETTSTAGTQMASLQPFPVHQGGPPGIASQQQQQFTQYQGVPQSQQPGGYPANVPHSGPPIHLFLATSSEYQRGFQHPGYPNYVHGSSMGPVPHGSNQGPSPPIQARGGVYQGHTVHANAPHQPPAHVQGGVQEHTQNVLQIFFPSSENHYQWTRSAPSNHPQTQAEYGPEVQPRTSAAFTPESFSQSQGSAELPTNNDILLMMGSISKDQQNLKEAVELLRLQTVWLFNKMGEVQWENRELHLQAQNSINQLTNLLHQPRYLASPNVEFPRNLRITTETFNEYSFTGNHHKGGADQESSTSEIAAHEQVGEILEEIPQPPAQVVSETHNDQETRQVTSPDDQTISNEAAKQSIAPTDTEILPNKSSFSETTGDVPSEQSVASTDTRVMPEQSNLSETTADVPSEQPSSGTPEPPKALPTIAEEVPENKVSGGSVATVQEVMTAKQSTASVSTLPSQEPVKQEGNAPSKKPVVHEELEKSRLAPNTTVVVPNVSNASGSKKLNGDVKPQGSVPPSLGSIGARFSSSELPPSRCYSAAVLEPAPRRSENGAPRSSSSYKAPRRKPQTVWDEISSKLPSSSQPGNQLPTTRKTPKPAGKDRVPSKISNSNPKKNPQGKVIPTSGNRFALLAAKMEEEEEEAEYAQRWRFRVASARTDQVNEGEKESARVKKPVDSRRDVGNGQSDEPESAKSKKVALKMSTTSSKQPDTGVQIGKKETVKAVSAGSTKAGGKQKRNAKPNKTFGGDQSESNGEVSRTVSALETNKISGDTQSGEKEELFQDDAQSIEQSSAEKGAFMESTTSSKQPDTGKLIGEKETAAVTADSPEPREEQEQNANPSKTVEGVQSTESLSTASDEEDVVAALETNKTSENVQSGEQSSAELRRQCKMNAAGSGGGDRCLEICEAESIEQEKGDNSTDQKTQEVPTTSSQIEKTRTVKTASAETKPSPVENKIYQIVVHNHFENGENDPRKKNEVLNGGNRSVQGPNEPCCSSSIPPPSDFSSQVVQSSSTTDQDNADKKKVEDVEERVRFAVQMFIFNQQNRRVSSENLHEQPDLIQTIIKFTSENQMVEDKQVLVDFFLERKRYCENNKKTFMALLYDEHLKDVTKVREVGSFLFHNQALEQDYFLLIWKQYIDFENRTEEVIKPYADVTESFGKDRRNKINSAWGLMQLLEKNADQYVEVQRQIRFGKIAPTNKSVIQKLLLNKNTQKIERFKTAAKDTEYFETRAKHYSEVEEPALAAYMTCLSRQKDEVLYWDSFCLAEHARKKSEKSIRKVDEEYILLVFEEMMRNPLQLETKKSE